MAEPIEEAVQTTEPLADEVAAEAIGTPAPPVEQASEEASASEGPEEADAEEADAEEADAEPWQVRIQRGNDRDILLVCGLIILMAFVLQVTPARDGVTLFGARLPESCGTKRLGWGECPGCGLTRSFILGVRLDPEAFRLHPAGPLLLLIVVAQIPYRAYRFYQRKRLREENLVDLRFARWQRLWRYFGVGVLLCILTGWFIRMGWIS